MDGNDHPIGARTGRPSVEELGTISLICMAWFLISVILLHLFDPALDPVDRQISEYALGPSAWLMTVAFVVVGVGMGAAGLGLRRSLAPAPRVWAAWLLAITGLFFLGVAAFPTDAPLADGTTANTFSGQMHAFAATIGPLFLVVGAYLLRGVFARDPRWHPLASATRWFAVAITLWFLISGTLVVALGPGRYTGAVQRLFWLALLGWFTVIGLQLRRLGVAPTAAPAAPAMRGAAG
jgi:hypothetical protein